MIKKLLPRLLRLCVKPALSPRVPVRVQRQWGRLIGHFLMGARGTSALYRNVAGVSTVLITPTGTRPLHDVLYLHGGGYVMGGEGSHGKFAAHFAGAAAARVWLPDYRLAPEHAFPAALDDALAVYGGLLSQGKKPEQITLAGDSAGGGLALATAVAIRDAGLPLPAALVLISPWVDLSLGGESHRTKANSDPLLSPKWIRSCAAAYRGGAAAREPRCSPLFADLRGLPPLLIQVGSEEILLSDSEQLAKAARAAGIATELTRFDGLWHVFQLHAGMLREADVALKQISRFIHKHTNLLSVEV